MGQVNFKELLKFPNLLKYFIVVNPGLRARNEMFLGHIYSQELL